MCLPTPLKHTFCFVSAHLSVALLGHQPLKRLLCPLHPASAASITPYLLGQSHLEALLYNEARVESRAMLRHIALNL